jgi:hypothetical protein
MAILGIEIASYMHMLAYEFYWLDESQSTHFVGILPERRRKQERITQESVMNWGKKYFLGGRSVTS